MAWIYSAESEDSLSHWTGWSDRLPTVKATDTRKLFSCLACLIEGLDWPQFGTTCERCAVTTFQTSTSFMGAFPAKTSQQLDVEQAWRESAADFISNSKGLSEKQNQLSSSLKTSLQSGHADLDVWCGDFPSSGMIAGGQLFQPLKLAPRTYASAGSYLPTPTATPYGSNQGGAAGRVGKKRESLDSMARMWPTPRVQDCRGERKETHDTRMAKRKAAGQSTGGYSSLAGQVGGQLNPTWIEWLMGYPSEWTALEDWATQWSRSKRKQRSKDS